MMKNYAAITASLVACPFCGANVGSPCKGDRGLGRAFKSSVHSGRRARARMARRGRLVGWPKVVVLCGSTRFYPEFQEANYRETMAGRIVLSVGAYAGARHGQEVGCTPEQKVALDELHKRKIDLADELLVLDVGGYIGESTRSEIVYAELWGKPVRYLSVEVRE